jgi:hypothetical protein
MSTRPESEELLGGRAMDSVLLPAPFWERATPP